MISSMRIAVFGAGAVGGYFGGRLAQAGVDVTFIARGAHLEAIQQKGLRVDSLLGNFRVHPARAVGDAQMVGAVDLVILGVKAWQVREAAQALKPLIGPETVVLPLQNGVDAARQLGEVLGANHVVGGLCRIISMIDAPGHINHVGGEPYLAFGDLQRQTDRRLAHLAQLFSRAEGMRVEVIDDIQVAIWKKFLLIAPWSGVGAVTRTPIGIIRDLAETREMLEDAMHEIFQLAVAQGIDLGPDAVSLMMAFVDSLPAEGTASMQRDIMAGQPSELIEQNGTVRRLGNSLGVATPVNSFIYSSLLPMERRARETLARQQSPS
jgi:2-dehydropantoate 2-reductase